MINVLRSMFSVQRWALDPTAVTAVVFLLQFGLWWAFMPVVSTVPGVAPRFDDTTSICRFASLMFALFAGSVAGKRLWRTTPARLCLQVPPAPQRFLVLLRIAVVALLFTAVGEAVYIRSIVTNPRMLLEMFQFGFGTTAGEMVGSERIVGISSLNNLFILPVAIYAYILFHPLSVRKSRRSAGALLSIIGVFSLFHAAILTARMFMIYYVLIVAAAYLLLRGSKARAVAARIWTVLAIVACLVYTAEMMRYGLVYAKTFGLSLASSKTQMAVGEYLTQAYLASDMNNAMIVFGCEPSMQMVSNSAFASIAPSFNIQFYSYESCDGWRSRYGTLNVLAIWWFDLGWWALPVAFATGSVLGYAYRRATSSAAQFWPITYLLAYPGLFANTRINYFGLTIFVVPAAFWVVLSVLLSGLGKSPSRTRSRIPNLRAERFPARSMTSVT